MRSDTLAALPGARTTSLGAIPVKGRAEPVDVHLLLALAADDADGGAARAPEDTD